MTLIDAAQAMQAHEQETCELELKTTLRDLIVAKFQATAIAQGKPLTGPLTEELVLLESGLDSLCFAIIVATLEDELGYDPFTEAEDVYFPVTFGDFVRFYERAR
jgi:acyl carrier protein